MSSLIKHASPDVYERHVGRYGAALAAEMARLAQLEPGRRALDVGCGPGSLTKALADALGPNAVAAVDPSEQFVAACRTRAPGVDVRVGVAEQLPFEDDLFDAALAQLVVDGMDDAPRGVAEMRRVTRPGGILVACVWDFDGGMTMLCTIREAALDLHEERARSFGAGVRLPFSRPSELEALWRAAGLLEVELGDVRVTAAYENFDDLWFPFAAGIGGLGRFVQSLDENDRALLKESVAQRLAAGTAPFELAARALWVRGRV